MFDKWFQTESDFYDKLENLINFLKTWNELSDNVFKSNFQILLRTSEINSYFKTSFRMMQINRLLQFRIKLFCMILLRDW